MKNACLLTLLSVCGFAQRPAILTPEDAVRRALSAHPSIEAGQSRVQAAQGLSVQASLRPNPRLFLQSENTRIPGSTPFRFSRETDNFAYASQVIERGDKRERRIDLAQQVTLRRTLELDLQRADITRRVLTAYWSTLGAEHLRDVLRINLTNFEQTVQYHRDRVREGAIAEVDLIRVELEKEQVAVAYQNAEQDARRFRLQLFREMGEPQASDAALTATLNDVKPFVGPSMEEALAQRADLRVSRQVIAQAKSAIALERANAAPDPEVLLGYKQSMGFNTLIAGVQVPMPFRNRNQGSIAGAIADERAARYEAETAILTARNEILTAETEFNQKLQLLTGNLPRIRAQAEDTVRIARAVYREGAGDLLRLLDAERAGLQAELLFIRTLIEYRLALVQLQSAMGMLP